MWRKRYQRVRQSFIVFQAIVRKNIEKNNFANYRNKILLLQALTRKWLSMILFKRHMFLVIKTQASVRRRKYQNRYFNIRRGFINFQSIIRQHQGRQKYHRIWALIVRIQSLMRQFLAKMTLFKKKKVEQHRQAAATKIQALCRGASARKKLWMDSIDLLREQAQKLYQEGRIQAAKKIQSIYRTYKDKVRYNRSRYLVVLLQSCGRRIVAKKNAPSNSIELKWFKVTLVFFFGKSENSSVA